MLHEKVPNLAKLVEPDRVRKEVYTDAEIFELEMERIHETRVDLLRPRKRRCRSPATTTPCRSAASR